MGVSFTAEFARMFCRFSDFGTPGLCDAWQWKLDPYKCSDRRKEEQSLLIRNADPDEAEKTLSVPAGAPVYEELNGFFLWQVYILPEGGTLWKCVRRIGGETMLAYRTDREWSEIVLLEDHSKTGGQMPYEYLGRLLVPCMLKRCRITFHGVLMEHEGRGIIISAPSGTGKTTHARMWRERRHALIINGDRTVCAKTDGVWTGCGIPWSGTSGEQINRCVPVSAMVVLGRGDRNEAVRITDPLEAFFAVLPHMQYPSWDKELSNRAMELLDDFLRAVPVIHLRCLPEPEAVDVLAEALCDLQGERRVKK